jgi:hypothetical protein
VVVGKSNVHDGASKNLATDNDGTDLGSVHAEDSTLRHVDDRGAHHAAEDTTVGNSESSSSHIFKGDLSFTSALGQIGKLNLKMVEVHFLAVADDWDDKTSRSGDSSADINEITVNHLVVINNSVDNGLLLEGLYGGLHESRHEAKLGSVLLLEGVLHVLTDFHKGAHINFVESSERSIGVLRLLKTLADSLAHAVHGDTGLKAGSRNLSRGFLGADTGILVSGCRGDGSTLLSNRGLEGSRSWFSGLTDELL